MNDLLTALMSRRSVRAYRDDAVEPDVRDRILEAMRRAPTAGNQTQYSVIEVEDPGARKTLALTCDNQPFIASAPWVLVFLADVQRLLDYYSHSGVTPKPPREGDALLATADAFVAAQTAVIAAEAEGLGSCYIGDILEHYETVRDLLNLPRYVLPVSLITFGYPTEQQRHRPQPGRMERSSFVFRDRYHRLRGDDLAHVYDYADPGPDRYRSGADTFGQHMHDRKYASDFMNELRRSVAVMFSYWR